MITPDLLVVVHFVFILFVIFGGLLALKYRPLVCLHLPALAWGILIEFCGWICPLTVYENQLRPDSSSYSNGFIEHYLLPVIYPPELTQEIQIALGLILIVFNGVIYWRVIHKWRNKR